METNPLLLFLFLSYLATTTIAQTNTTTATTNLSMCLISAKVRNFTIASSQPSASIPSSSLYYHLPNFSIHNQRFTDPSFAKPVALVLPETKEQLRGAVLCCRHASLAIRIRSGGHSYEGLSYVSQQNRSFVVIDMMNLNQVSVDSKSSTAWVESGATLGEIYHAIAELSNSLAFPAGSCSTVGSGGHISGGGFGFLSRKYGLAADNVIDAVLVNSEGGLLNRESMGEDVFWAIRGGGGGSWGAVYAWRIKLVPVPKRVTRFTISRTGTSLQAAELVYKWQHVAPSLPDEFYLSTFISASNSSSISASFSGLYLGPKRVAVSILSRQFPELGGKESDGVEVSWIESVVYFANLNSISDLKDRGSRWKGYFKAKSDYVRAPISKVDLKRAFDLLEKETKAYIILDPYGGAMSRVEGGEIAFPHRSGNLYGIQYMIDWEEEDNWKSDGYIEWLRGFYGYMEPFVSKNPRAAYVNYLDLDLGSSESVKRSGGGYRDPVGEGRVWGERYFLGNYDRLVWAKTVIDPKNVFSNEQSIPPLHSHRS